MTLTWEVASESLLQASDRLRITLRRRQEGRRDKRGPSCLSLHRGTKLGEVGPLLPVFVVECDSLEALEPLDPQLLDEASAHSLRWPGINIPLLEFKGDDRVFAFTRSLQRPMKEDKWPQIPLTAQPADSSYIATDLSPPPPPPPPPPPASPAPPPFSRRHKRSSSHQGHLTESQQLSRWMLDEGSIVQPIRSSENEPIEAEAEQRMMTHRGAALDALRHASNDLESSSLPLSLILPTSLVGSNTSSSSNEPQMKHVLGLLFGDRTLKPIQASLQPALPPLPPLPRPPLHPQAAPSTSSSKMGPLDTIRSLASSRRPSASSLITSPSAITSSQAPPTPSHTNSNLNPQNFNISSSTRPETKVRDMSQLAPDLRALQAVVERLRTAEALRSEAQARLASLLQLRSSNVSSIHQPLQSLTNSLDRLRTRNRDQSSLLAESVSQNASTLSHLTSKIDNLTVGCTRLKAAVQRKAEAEASLSGSEGFGQWRALLSQVVARRSQMISTLASLYEIGPVPNGKQGLGAYIPPLDGEALEKTLDYMWGGAPGSSPPSRPSALPTTSRGGSNRGQGTSNPSAASSSGPIRLPPPQLSILGLSLPDQMVKRILLGQLEESSGGFFSSLALGGGSSFDEDERIAAALGYLAHLVDRISVILDVQLRYPLIPCMSCSRLLDHAPLMELQEALQGSSSSFLARGLTRLFSSSPSFPFPSPSQDPSHPPSKRLASSDAISEPGRQEHHIPGLLLGSIGRHLGGETVLDLPLFLDTSSGYSIVEQRNRMALAAHLLNKNVEVLLQAHGLTPSSSNILKNLFLLVCASRSAVR